MSTHTLLKPFSCDMCCKVYKRKGQAQRHRTQGFQTALCGLCEEVFANDAYLRLHERSRHHEDGEEACHHVDRRSHDCPECGRCFAWSFALDCHMRSHYKGKQPYRCDECDAAFSLSWELARHRATHEELRAHCDLCGRGFLGEVELRRHMARRHCQLWRYVCGECGQRFQSDDGLCRHLLRHLGRQPPRCCQRSAQRSKHRMSWKLARHPASRDQFRAHSDLCG